MADAQTTALEVDNRVLATMRTLSRRIENHDESGRSDAEHGRDGEMLASRVLVMLGDANVDDAIKFDVEMALDKLQHTAFELIKVLYRVGWDSAAEDTMDEMINLLPTAMQSELDAIASR